MLLILHLNLATLILIDSLGETLGALSVVWEPQHLRKRSCCAIVNAVSLALQLDKTLQENKSEPSILLLDPNPDHLTLALLRAGSSVSILYGTNDISARVAKTMFSVMFTCLEVVSQICYTASDALTSLRGSFSNLDLRLSSSASLV